MAGESTAAMRSPSDWIPSDDHPLPESCQPWVPRRKSDAAMTSPTAAPAGLHNTESSSATAQIPLVTRIVRRWGCFWECVQVWVRVRVQSVRAFGSRLPFNAVPSSVIDNPFHNDVIDDDAIDSLLKPGRNCSAGFSIF